MNLRKSRQKVDLKPIPFHEEHNTKTVLEKYSVKHHQKKPGVFNGEESSESRHVSHDQEDTSISEKEGD